MGGRPALTSGPLQARNRPGIPSPTYRDTCPHLQGHLPPHPGPFQSQAPIRAPFEPFLWGLIPTSWAVLATTVCVLHQDTSGSRNLCSVLTLKAALFSASLPQNDWMNIFGNDPVDREGLITTSSSGTFVLTWWDVICIFIRWVSVWVVVRVIHHFEGRSEYDVLSKPV